MKASTKRILWALGPVILLVVGLGCYYLWQIALIGTAYKSKILCSAVFISKRDANAVLNQDLLIDDLKVLKYFDVDIDYEEKSVTASFKGLAKRKAIFRPGLGCTLAIGCSEQSLQSQIHPNQDYLSPPRWDQLWPIGERAQTDELPPEINPTKLSETLDAAFSEPYPERPRRTRAIVVVYNGHIIAERYAKGFSNNTPLIGWSMTKSVINALIGILVGQGRVSLEDQVLLGEWRKPNDGRRDITLDQLLRMTSGLKFAEGNTSLLEDVMFMLLVTGDMAAYAAHKPLESNPGSKWSYSSGTTNIISRIVRNAVGGTGTDYFSFPRRALFDRIGMHSAIIEPDASGIFVGSSFMYATARDWARFGLLYLQDGIWGGERILPKGWVEYSRNPTPGAPMEEYGAHFWLKVPPYYRSGINPKTSLPSDMFMAAGHEGQFVTIIPSRKLVVVRLGLSRLPGSWDQEWFIEQILETISDRREDS